ncbi:TPA: Holliday junction resolvase RuvX [bacterium]|nr:Holliday junction resolvase RuvX [bacterium]
MRILGLDIGDIKIGVAISDEDGIISQGLCVIERKDMKKEFKKIIHKYKPEMIVCGMPTTMDGRRGYQAKKVLSFISELSLITDVPIETYNERLTTKEAEKILEEANIKQKKKKAFVDKISAQLILQGFLDRRKTTAMNLDHYSYFRI